MAAKRSSSNGPVGDITPELPANRNSDMRNHNDNGGLERGPELPGRRDRFVIDMAKLR
jgi:hypothetical protein